MSKFVRLSHIAASLALSAAALGGCSLLVDFTECERSEDCTGLYGAGSQCGASGVCSAPVPPSEQPACQFDADCDQGEQCREQGCVPVEESPGLCQADADCESLLGSGATCSQQGQCQAPPPSSAECSESLPCAQGQSCEQGQCVPLQSSAECEADADCSQGKSCEQGQCVPVQSTPECSESLPCAEGKSCEQGQCVPVQSSAECEVDADCVALHGAGYRCTPEQTCQAPPPVLGGPCNQGFGPYDDPSAFRVGVLLPLSGPEEGFGRPLLNAVRLAQSDINRVGGVSNRRVGLVVCDTEGLDDKALEGARHLVDNSGTTAIIGPDYSSQTIDVATQVTIPNGVLLVTPSGTATAISNLADEDLVWRTTPSDAIQGIALGRLVSEAVTRGLAGPAEAVKIALLVRNNDTYASGLGEALTGALPSEILFGGDARFVTSGFPNSSAGEGSDYTGIVGNLLSQSVKPNIVIVLGSSEAWEIARMLDSSLEPPHNTLFFFADAAKNGDEALLTPEVLRNRIWGTAPQNVGESNYPPYLSFRIKYMQAYFNSDPNQDQFVANAFDAMYLVAMAATAEGFGGRDMARGMARLSQGEEISPTQDSYLRAGQLLRQGEPVNYRGASGPLDFDAKGDPQAGPVSLWCFDATGVPERGVLLDNTGTFTWRSCQGT